MTNLTSTLGVENAWRSYETTAFVHVPDPQAYSLRPNKGVVAGTENVYMLSVHHQLHCLKQLHLDFVRSLGATARNSTALGGRDMQDLKHVEHCFEYLRQAIVCAGDATLEGPDPGRSSLTGIGVVHRCRAWDGPRGLETWRRAHQP
ncbi:uncharacterized protein THITE_2053249 [Thermothielavioides terrestris NRRL 8126]|uniref:Uncharacterized protein n=1 Tax=Thermothielavioides terrestris (strain ATCC 38088 / NRRL 8126) TaxID=578455 RepID=G2R9F0_THETT|nr:uncharacterized protein THITE_2053249 [Thermothielavioides terrestris NRRL 8126]AEO68691.1 hypothetical protein THITE_2053249 [Thermothielavioides terrestris NRRL 8126]